MDIIPIVKITSGRIDIDSEVTVCGWIRTRRDSKIGISFLTIYDGSCLQPVQAIAKNSLVNYKDDVLRLTSGCSVIITGKVLSSPGRKQDFEVMITTLKVTGWVEDPDTYPISAKKHSVKYLREASHLRARTNLIGAVARVRHTLALALHNFFSDKGYFWVSTPIITSFNTEGAGKMFRVSTLDMENLPRTLEGKVDYREDFFGKDSFLTVSGQLNGETYACALSKIYTFGPVFRAENSNTGRHLAEFWMLEPEVAFANLDNIIELAEDMLKYVFRMVLKERKDDMQFFSEQINSEVISRLERFIFANLTQIEYTDAIALLEKSGEKFDKNIYWGIDLSSEHERYLTDKYYNTPIVIKNHPKSVKAFYMRLNHDNETVSSMDILVPSVGEIIGGSQREERLSVLDARIEEMGLSKESYCWYRDLRRYGTVPHSGFGLGFERLLSYITGIRNVRDVVPFPRTSRNASF